MDVVPHPKYNVYLLQRGIHAFPGRLVARSASRIIVLNSRVNDFLLGRGARGSKIEFLPNGVDTERFSPAKNVQEKYRLRNEYGLPADKVLTLFVGRFVPRKGIDALLGAERIEGMDLVLVGGKRPHGHKRDDHHFLGSISHEYMHDVFKMCDIFVLPSRGEGFPVSVQEAMATGLPVVTTDDPAYEPYLLDRSSVTLVEPDDKTLTAALHKLAKNPALRSKMASILVHMRCKTLACIPMRRD